VCIAGEWRVAKGGEGDSRAVIFIRLNIFSYCGGTYEERQCTGRPRGVVVPLGIDQFARRVGRGPKRGSRGQPVQAGREAGPLVEATVEQAPSAGMVAKAPPGPGGRYAGSNVGVGGAKAGPKHLSRGFTVSQTTKYPKCHSASRKSGPLCMVILPCTVHPHTKIAPQSNFQPLVLHFAFLHPKWGR